MHNSVVLAALLVLAGCDMPENTTDECRQHDDVVKKWMQTELHTALEFEQEVEALLPDKSCRGITPAILRKVIRDAQRIPPLQPHPPESGLGGGFGYHVPRQ